MKKIMIFFETWQGTTRAIIIAFSALLVSALPGIDNLGYLKGNLTFWGLASVLFFVSYTFSVTYMDKEFFFAKGEGKDLSLAKEIRERSKINLNTPYFGAILVIPLLLWNGYSLGSLIGDGITFWIAEETGKYLASLSDAFRSEYQEHEKDGTRWSTVHKVKGFFNDDKDEPEPPII